MSLFSLGFYCYKDSPLYVYRNVMLLCPGLLMKFNFMSHFMKSMSDEINVSVTYGCLYKLGSIMAAIH